MMTPSAGTRRRTCRKISQTCQSERLSETLGQDRHGQGSGTCLFYARPEFFHKPLRKSGVNVQKKCGKGRMLTRRCHADGVYDNGFSKIRLTRHLTYVV